MGCHEKWKSKLEKGDGNGGHLVEFAFAMGHRVKSPPEGSHICKSFHLKQESLFG